MRLLNTRTLKIETFQGVARIPPYAILSHRWEDEEILFEDFELHAVSEEHALLEQRLGYLELQLNAVCKLVQDGSLQAPASAIGDLLDDDVSIIGTDSDDTLQRSITTSSEGQRTYSRNVMSQSHEDLDDEQFWPGITSPSAKFAHLSKVVRKKGWVKVKHCCKEASRLGLRYVWIDTCCISQRSSSELHESINSMMAWYRDAKLCIAYLSDVIKGPGDQFTRSVWFERAWTLQELIAPKEVWFYQRDWCFIGLRSAMSDRISYITGIERSVLHPNGLQSLHNFSVANRFSWAAGRRASRPEDRAYSLLGIFGVNMPTLYGEGEAAAFYRLQIQILQAVPDYSILAWTSQKPTDPDDGDEHHLFATSPDFFQSAKLINSASYDALRTMSPALSRTVSLDDSPYQYSKYGHGTRIQLLIRTFKIDERMGQIFQACLPCKARNSNKIFLIRLAEISPGHFRRLSNGYELAPKTTLDHLGWTLQDVHVYTPQPILQPQRTGRAFSSEYLTVILDPSQLTKSSLDLGYHSWRKTVLPTRSSASYSRLTIKLRSRISKSKRKTLEDRKDPSLIPDEIAGDEDYGAFILRDIRTGETIAIFLAVVACRLKAAIVTNLPESDFVDGGSGGGVGLGRLGEIRDIEWEDLSLVVVNKGLRSGRTVFVGCMMSNDLDSAHIPLIVGVKP